MGRIEKHYLRQFEALFRKQGVADPARAATNLFQSIRQRSAQTGQSLSYALAREYADLAQDSESRPKRFVCDAGLGGLARWLRGSGYEAEWNPELDDAEVIPEARRLGATLITTDSLMMERGVLRDRIVAALFVPSALTCEQQLEVVFRELRLTLRESRCMSCGGALRAVAKESVADRIPPRTAAWLDEYFVCAECGRLFWRGTHWRQMQDRLARL